MPPETVDIHPERWQEGLREARDGRFVLLANLVRQTAAWVEAFERRKLRDTDLPPEVWAYLVELHNPTSHARRGRPARNGWASQLMRDAYEGWYPFIKAMRRGKWPRGVRKPVFNGIEAYGRGQTPTELARQWVAILFKTSADNVKDALRVRRPPSRIKHPKR